MGMKQKCQAGMKKEQTRRAAVPDTRAQAALPSASDWSADLAEQVADQFLIDPDYQYFNTGGIGPTVKSALDETVGTMRALQGRVNHGHSLIEKTRDVVAKFVGCSPDELAFMRNATEGNSTVSSGLSLQEGDEVIIDSHAHQGGSMGWMTRQKYNGVIVKAFQPSVTSAQENIDRIESLITDRTRAVSISHVTAPTGIHLPAVEIGRLCRQGSRQIWFHIDGAQSLGMLPLKVSDLGCDSFAACGHKWCCGPVGTGVLFVRAGLLDQIVPSDVGAYADASWSGPEGLECVRSARGVDCGTRDPSTIVGLG